MTLEVSLQGDLPAQLRRFAAEFGETSEQALIRLAANTGRYAARETEPKGKSPAIRKQIERAIEAGIWRACYVVLDKRYFTALRKKRRPTILWGKKSARFRIHQGQITDSFDEVWKHIENHRTKYGHVDKLGPLQVKVIPASLEKKLLSRRSGRLRLAGVAKGGWLGAAKKAERWVEWNDRMVIGKNEMNWAQKWMHVGTARKVRMGESHMHIELVNKAYYIKHIFDQKAADGAVDRAWDGTLKWYRSAVGALDRRVAA